MKSYTAYFTDGTSLEFDAKCNIGAREYADYRSKLCGVPLHYLADTKTGRRIYSKEEKS